MGGLFCFVRILIPIIFDLGKPLRCYACETHKSWEDCSQHKKHITCPDFCVKVKYEATDTTTGHKQPMYKRGCIEQTYSQKDQTQCRYGFKDGKSLKCYVNTCNTDFCNNEGSKSKLTFGVLLASVFVFVALY